MEDASYRYLDDERIKLWNELRQTQAQLNSLMEIAEGDQNAVENGLRRLGLKAARAYNKLTEREEIFLALFFVVFRQSRQVNHIDRTDQWRVYIRQAADEIRRNLI